MLDEPFSGLDPMAVDTVLGVLRETAARGVPVLFSSHQLDVVERLCDDVVVIADGTIRAAGPQEELRKQAGPAAWELLVDGDVAWLRDEPGVARARVRRRVRGLRGRRHHRPARPAACRPTRRRRVVLAAGAAAQRGLPGGRPMNNSFVQAVRLVSAREIQARIRSKAFVVSALILIGMVVASIVVGGIVEQGHRRRHHPGRGRRRRLAADAPAAST